MTGPVPVIPGANEFQRQIRAAERMLMDLSAPYAEASNVAMRAAKPQTPKRSGALAGTVRSEATKEMGQVAAGSPQVPYAGVIHWGWPRHHIEAQPWLSEAATRSESTWIQAFEKQMDDAVDLMAGKYL